MSRQNSVKLGVKLSSTFNGFPAPVVYALEELEQG
jgi:hypothetical protein